jgi:hypothetical protein
MFDLRLIRADALKLRRRRGMLALCGILNITSDSTGALSAPLAPALAAAVSIAWASATFAAAAALLRRRDLV